jgi:4-amino-4-deoxy-L-arabinose transferase-like glycosyltransferase
MLGAARRWFATAIGRRPDARSVALGCAVALITTAGALLRVDALTARYGPLAQPAWAQALDQQVAPAARHLRPAHVSWPPETSPYVGGDPINYLRFAREMRHFYQGHVREPMFLGLTRIWLALTGDRDVAVSFASASAGTLAVPATFLVGATAVSPLVGLLAALALAIEFDAIGWSVDGWRDDTFMLFLALSAWTFLRLRQRPTVGGAVLAGVVAAGACLTRLTALSFVVPGLIWTVAASAAARPIAARRAGLAAMVAALLVMPYLINTARVTGDPFFAINYHTRYYRHAEGLPPDESVGAVQYITAKLVNRPMATIDTAMEGLFVWPFVTKWHGFEPWRAGLGTLLRWCAAAGLVLALWSPDGRLLLVVLFASLMPVAFTWAVGGGGEWRFTQHVYPLYLVAAFAAIVLSARGASAALHRGWRPVAWRRRGIEVAGAALLAASGLLVYRALPVLVVREALAAAEPASLTAGGRDGGYFAGDWSEPRRQGSVTVRVAQAERVSLRVPLPRRTAAYRLTLRMDPAETADPGRQPRVAVFLNRRPLGQFHLRRDPQRMGTYRMQVPPELTGAPTNQLDLVASHTVPAAEAGPHYTWLPPEAPVAFRLWYVRLEPE